MGDEDDGLAGLAPQPQKFQVQVLPRDLVQSAKGLVHEQKLRVEGQRTGDGDALLHPARELPGVVAGELLQPHQGQHPLSTGFMLGFREAHHLQRQHHVL